MIQNKYDMKFKILVLLILTSFSTTNAQTIRVKNSSNVELKDIMVEIPAVKLKLANGEYSVISASGVRVPLEFVTDLKTNRKAIFVVDKLTPNSTKDFRVVQGAAADYPKRSYAELSHKIGGRFNGKSYEGRFSWVKPNFMRIPGSFRDHAYYIKYEGPGWESDKIAYRFYLDQRNAIDVFGKKTPGIVLPAIGVDGYDSYHSMSDWGMDNMKVGKALGIGSIAYWDGTKAIRVESRDSALCHIPADGKLRSQVLTNYYGWDVGKTKFNLKSLISIDAGSKASRMELLADQPIDNLATGIIKSKDAELLTSVNSAGEWAYMATFGKQSLNNDNMGLAIFYKKHQLQSLTADDLNHVLVLAPDKGYLEYYFMATWELDWEAVKDKASFLLKLEEMLNTLNQKPIVQINRK